MSLKQIEVIENVESFLPLYELSLNKLKIIAYTEERESYYKTPTQNAIVESTTSEELIDLDLLEGTEGQEKLVKHLKKERNYVFMKKCKELFAKKDELLHCEICGFSFIESYGEIGKDFIEGHHTIPISMLENETVIKSTDILMVCSNCHRMLHRRNPCYTKDEIIQSLKNNNLNPDLKIKIIKMTTGQ